MFSLCSSHWLNVGTNSEMPHNVYSLFFSFSLLFLNFVSYSVKTISCYRKILMIRSQIVGGFKDIAHGSIPDLCNDGYNNKHASSFG